MKKETNELILKRIQEACEQKDIKLTNLDIALGFSRGYVAKMAKAIKSPPIERIKAIADYLDVSYEWLMYGETEEKESEEGSRWYFSDATAALAQQLQENKGQRVLLDAARDLTEEELKSFAQLIQAYKTNKEYD